MFIKETSSFNLFIFSQIRNETSRVTLHFYQNDKRVQELIYNQEYELRAAMTKPDGKVSFF